MGGISVLFFIVVFYLLIVCLMAYERGWIGGALCLYIYGRYTWSIYICEIADDGDLKDTEGLYCCVRYYNV